MPRFQTFSRHPVAQVRRRKHRTRSVSARCQRQYPQEVSTNIIPRKSHVVSRKYLGIIQQLYIGRYQCRTCGLRFSAKQKNSYNHHLDWHYWENRQAASSAALLQTCRDWYPSLQDWTTHEENLDEKMKNNQLMLGKNRSLKQSDERSSVSSSEIVSCPAAGNENTDDDVGLTRKSMDASRLTCFSSSVAASATIHSRTSLMTIEKNGI